MVVARAAGEGRFEVVTRHKEVVRLGESGEDHLKELTPAAIDRGIAALTRCRAILDNFDAPYSAVATSAVREAENRSVFLERARAEAGIEVEVISGHEEARLIHLGVLQALSVYDQVLMLCDIGGGSTELLIGKGAKSKIARSFKLGAIRLTEAYFPNGNCSPRTIGKARRFLRSSLAGFVHECERYKIETFVGSSGTIETLLRMAMAARRSEVQNLNGATFTAAELKSAIDLLIAAPDPEERARIPGVDAGRADILLGGALILEAVLDAFAIETVQFSEYALREGALFDLYSRLEGSKPNQLSDIRSSSVMHLMELCDDDPEHSHQVARLALALFDGLTDLHGLGPVDRGLLEAGALLANVGLSIAHSRHHQHSYYVIRNSEQLSGFNDHEIEIIAQVARYHRRSRPSLKHREFAALGEADQHRVQWCAAVLRIAIGLDRSHAGAVGSLRVKISATSITIVVEPSQADPDSISLELYSAEERSGLLASLAEREVVFELAANSVVAR
jgi:exopolyphosphatase/guanosine-5'-triphosphate,3'-diphosphate pyrophosphatase